MLKKIMSCLREYKKATILTPILVSIEVVLEVLIPIFTGVLVNIVDLKNGTVDETKLDNLTSAVLKFFGGTTDSVLLKVIIILGISVCLLALLSLLFGTLSGLQCSKAGAGFAKNLRRDIFVSLQKFSFENIDKIPNSSLVTRLTTDIMRVRMAFQMVIRTAVRSPLMLVFALIGSFFISPKLSIIFLIIVPILAVGLLVIHLKAHPIFERVFYKYDDLNTVVQENVRGIRVVKSFVREDFETKKFNETSHSIYSDFVKAEKIVSFNGPLMQFAIYASMILISYIGARYIVSGTGGINNQALTTGNLTTMITFVSLILNSLMMLSMVLVNVIISQASARRIYEVLIEEPTIKNIESPICEVKNGDIEFKNVNFSYSKNNEKLILQNINLKINSGETIGIIGGTGSSKTSLVQLIPRLYDVYEGEVTVGGINVKNYDLKTLRDSVAMVLQKNTLFAGTIKENLRWGKENATDEEMINVCKLSQADEFIQKFPLKYDTFLEQEGSNVSGGQKQRLCIARALLKTPKILILDDSTSAVDTKTDALIRKSFASNIPDVTKIIIAQRISSVEDADKIIVMDKGNIVNFGTHEQLLKESKIYQEVYYSQNKGGIENE